MDRPRHLPASASNENGLAFPRHLTEDRDPPTALPDDKLALALEQCSRLRSVAGWRTVPTWIEIAGELHSLHGIPIKLYLAFLSLIQQRLVSLDASEDSPKPMRFIEYDSDNATHRCFAEVELLLNEDNTLRIAVLRHRREPASVRAVASVY
jgi:hypothetical protein